MSPFDISYGVSCRKVELVTQHQNEVRDANEDLSDVMQNQVSRDSLEKTFSSFQGIQEMTKRVGP